MIVIQGETHLQVLVDTYLEEINKINTIINIILITGIIDMINGEVHNPMPGLMRNTINSTHHPSTHPPLH